MAVRSRKDAKEGQNAVVSLHKTIKPKGLPEGTSVQAAEIMALTTALALRKDKALTCLHRHKIRILCGPCLCCILEDKGILNATNQEIKYAIEMLAMLQVMEMPGQIAVVHCWGHEMGTLKY